MKFFIQIEPDIPKVTHQSGTRHSVGKDGKPFTYKSPSLQNWENLLISRISKFKPERPMQGPVKLFALFCFRGKETGWRTQKPDCDNLVKTVKDCMTKCGFWKDDSQVCKLEVSKLNLPDGEIHGIEISVVEL